MTAFFDANVIDWSNINSFGTSRRRDYRGQNKVATMNPGLAHVAVAWQLAAEIIVPLNREVGNSTGCRTQLMFFSTISYLCCSTSSCSATSQIAV